MLELDVTFKGWQLNRARLSTTSFLVSRISNMRVAEAEAWLKLVDDKTSRAIGRNR